MTDRTDRIPLSPGVVRCEPQKACTVRSRCARGIAVIPQGSKLMDFSLEPGGAGPLCPGFMSAATIRIEHERKRTVKPWPKGED